MQGLKDRGLHGVQLVISDDHSRFGSGPTSGLGQCSLAALPVPPAAECRGLCAQAGDARWKWPPISGPCSMPRTAKPPRNSCKQPSRNMPRQPHGCRPGWRRTWQKDLRCSTFRWNTGGPIRTTNSLERINEEIRRRTRVVGIFPNEAACLRLISALLMETSEEWQIGKTVLCWQVIELLKNDGYF